MKKYLAEMVGTMVLVLMGCGSAVFAGHAAGAVSAGVGTLGVALALVRGGYGLYYRRHIGLPHQSCHHAGRLDVRADER